MTTVEQEWVFPSPETAFQAIIDGTVRARSTLMAQTPEARKAIQTAIAKTISQYKRGSEYVVPMPAVLASAKKP